MTIRWKTWLVTFSFMLLVLFIFGGLQHQELGGKLDRQMRDNIDAYVAQQASEINKMLEERQNQAELLANLIEKQSDLNNKAIVDLMILLAAEKGIDAVSVQYLDAEQKPTRTFSYGMNHDTNLAQEHESFLMGLIGKVKPTDAGSWHTSPLGDGKPGLVLQYVRCVMLQDKSTALVGVAFEVTELTDLVKAMHLSSRDYGVLFDPDMNFYYHPTFKQGTNLRSAYNGQFIPVADHIQLHPQSGQADYNWFDQRGKLFVYHRLINNWVVGLTVFKEDITVSAFNFKLLLGGLVVALLGSIALFMNLSNWVTGPLREMAFMLQEMGLGHYEQAMSGRYLKRRDEMGVMGRAVEKMRVLQLEHLEGLRVYQELVENKVLEKMDSLSRSNEELEQSLVKMEDQNRELHGVEEACLEVKEELITAKTRLYQAGRVLAQGAVTQSAVAEFEQENENVLSVASYIKREINFGMIKLGVLEDEDRKEAENMMFQNLLDSADLIIQSVENNEVILAELAVLGSKHVEKKEAFHVRERLVMATDCLNIPGKAAFTEALILCDHDEMMIGDMEIFDQILNLLIADSLSERLKKPTRGHIYIRFESKEDCKKMVFSSDCSVEEMGESFENMGHFDDGCNNLYAKTAEGLLHQYFKGQLTCTTSRDSGNLYHLIFND